MSYNLADTNDETRHWLGAAISYKPGINASNIFEQINLNELAMYIVQYILISQLVENRGYAYIDIQKKSMVTEFSIHIML